METKFKIGDTVWVLTSRIDATEPCDGCGISKFNNITEPTSALIREISAKWDIGGVTDQWFHLTYLNGDNDPKARNIEDVFATKEDAVVEYEKKKLKESKVNKND